MSDLWAIKNNDDEMWQMVEHEPFICWEKRHVLACPFCEGDPAPLDENDHTSCTEISCGSTAYMHVDAWNNRPAMACYARIEELEADQAAWLSDVPDLRDAIHLLEEARGFAALSPQGRDNIEAAIGMLDDAAEATYRKGFVDGERHERDT